MKLLVILISINALFKHSSGFQLQENRESIRKLIIFVNEIVRSRSIDTSYFLNSMQNVCVINESAESFILYTKSCRLRED